MNAVPRWLVVLCVALVFLGVTKREVWKNDETRVTAIALEMSQQGDIVVPRLLGEPFVEKPPLFYAAAAGMIRLAGPVIGLVPSVRATSACFGATTLLFVYLLTRRLSSRHAALLSVVMLGTSYGFLRESHTIRVDVALLAFVSGAVWAQAEAYLAGRRWMLAAAGVFVGLAFLVKGPVGIALAGTAWIGLFLPWVSGSTAPEARRWIVPHLVALLAMTAFIAAWLVPFRREAGDALWNEWLWSNHAGRFSGDADLGHTGEGLRPGFYVLGVGMLCLPWTPLPFVWLVARVRSLLSTHSLSKRDALLMAWGFGSLALLSLPATKRNVYILPALPAFAIMSADLIEAGMASVWRRLYGMITAGCFLFVVMALITPVLFAVWPDMPGGSSLREVFLDRYELTHMVPALALVAMTMLLDSRRIPTMVRPIGYVALTYLVLLAIAGSTLERARGRAEETRTLIASIPACERPMVAGVALDDATRRLLYIHGGRDVPTVDESRMAAILLGNDPQYDSVLVELLPSDLAVLSIPHSVRAESYLGDDVDTPSDEPRIYWLERADGG